MKTRSDRELLAVYDALPDLLELANERSKSTGDNSYKIQDALRDEFYAQAKAFRWSMPYRSLFECFQCGQMTTQIKHALVNPSMREINPALHAVDITEEEIHGIREHGAAFSTECREFLEQVSDQLE